MISRSPTCTSVMFSLAMAERSSLVAPSRWMVIAWLSPGLTTVITFRGGEFGLCGPDACATTTVPAIETPDPSRVEQHRAGSRGSPEQPDARLNCRSRRPYGRRPQSRSRADVKLFLTLLFRQRTCPAALIKRGTVVKSQRAGVPSMDELRRLTDCGDRGTPEGNGETRPARGFWSL